MVGDLAAVNEMVVSTESNRRICLIAQMFKTELPDHFNIGGTFP